MLITWAGRPGILKEEGGYFTLGGATAASSAIASIAAAVVALGQGEGTVSAGINQLNFATGLAQPQVPIMHRIRDADVAVEADNLAKSQTPMQSMMAVLSQANQIPQSS
jgi:flagellin-like hook-associated protein FlgL